MIRSLVGGVVLAGVSLTGFAGSAGAPDTAHVVPLAFTLITEGPADACAGKCRQLIAASGMITADTPRQFLAFTRENPAPDHVRSPAHIGRSAALIGEDVLAS